MDKSIEVRLDALDTKLPLKVKACIQKQPCVTADAPRNSTLKTSVGFFFTLDDHQQLLQVPVTLDITAGGKTIAHGSVEVPVIQDYVRGPGGKTANCGGRGAITVSATGDVEAVPLRVGR
ncbi:MAG: hypothetical protein QOC82_1485 [Frankiaceae bacterium]|nr:hypothetical protein [Frankiaceae bacterium]MDQ1699944.1 hypothetical protein [Frankiaceae bacterium]